MDEGMKKAYDARHKQAFRIAFDALNEVFPPVNTVEYWEQTNEHLKEIYNQHRDNPLCRALLVAVENYLGEAVKEIGEQGEG